MHSVHFGIDIYLAFYIKVPLFQLYSNGQLENLHISLQHGLSNDQK